MQTPKWYGVVRILLGIAFVMAGLMKFLNPEAQKALFEPYPGGLQQLVGIAEIAGGAALLANKYVRWATLGLIVIMLGAVVTHIMLKQAPRAIPALVLLVLNILVYTKAPAGR